MIPVFILQLSNMYLCLVILLQDILIICLNMYYKTMTALKEKADSIKKLKINFLRPYLYLQNSNLLHTDVERKTVISKDRGSTKNYILCTLINIFVFSKNYNSDVIFFLFTLRIFLNDSKILIYFVCIF